jgi:hypothetical protein
MGAQVAWWQLGFTARRAVLRGARRGISFPEPETWDVAVGWAWQLLAAPRWWRVIRGAGVAVLVMVGLAGMANVLAGVPDLVAVAGAMALCLPLATGWTWRQARCARAVARLAPDYLVSPPTRLGWLVRAVAVLVAAGSAAGVLAWAIGNERAAVYGCLRFTVDAPVHGWWERHGGESGVGCPTGDTRVGPGGVRYTPWSARQSTTRPLKDLVVYTAPVLGPVRMTPAVFAAWTAAGGPQGTFGEPIDGGWLGTTEFLNFQGGSISLSDGGQPEVHIGHYEAGVGGPCVPRDRPCVTVAYADRAGLHLAWQYGAADAFNVGWWPENAPPDFVFSREVAGYQLTWPDPGLADAYVAEVQACDKHFLARSTCTPVSARVLIRVR